MTFISQHACFTQVKAERKNCLPFSRLRNRSAALHHRLPLFMTSDPTSSSTNLQTPHTYMRLHILLPRSYATTSPRVSQRPPSKKSPSLSLSHFLLRQRALSLYRTIIRACYKIPPSTREEMKRYAREEFERHRDVNDSGKIRYLLSTGKTEFERLGKQVSGMG